MASEGSGHIGRDRQPRQPSGRDRRRRWGAGSWAALSLLTAACVTQAPVRAEARSEPTQAVPQTAPQMATETATAVDCAAARPPALRVDVLAAHSDTGHVIATLWGGDRTRFLKHHGWIARGSAPISGRVAHICFALSGPGVYAVSLYHDENDNQHFDRTMLGLPEEGFGVSNDAPTPIGLPAFDAVKMQIGPAGAVTSIHLRY